MNSTPNSDAIDALKLNEAESRYFGDLMTFCDAENTGMVSVRDVTEMFHAARIGDGLFINAMYLADVPQNAVSMNRLQFYSSLKLLAAILADVPLHRDILTSSLNIPLPRFAWKFPSSSSSLNKLSEPGNNTDVGAIDENGRVDIEIRNSNTADRSNTQTSQNEATGTDLQSTDSEVENNESSDARHHHTSRSPEAWSTNSDSPTPTNSVAKRPWVKDKFWQGILGDEHRQLLGTEEESSDRHSSDDENDIDLESIYQITSEQQEYYNKQFKAIQPDPDGLVSGHIARVFFEKSRIPIEELRHIWQLCDVTRDGALSIGEFTAAMHLVVLRRNNIPLPQTLPPCLNPSMLRKQVKTASAVEPPEADLLHLDDDEKSDSMEAKLTTNEEDSKQTRNEEDSKQKIVPINSENLTASKVSKEQHIPIAASENNKIHSVSDSSHGNASPSNVSGKEPSKDWMNTNREWTKFTESPTSSVSSPGPKPVNFDMQRTAQAVVSDPLILHPVPLRVTPNAADVFDDETLSVHRLSDTLQSDGSIVLDSGISPKKNLIQSNTFNNNQQQLHRDSLPGNDLRAIQRPQAKKRQSKNIGAIPPPPQREASIGLSEIREASNPDNITGNNLINKKEVPPLPPPRPHRHTRSSSLDLNKLKLANGSNLHDVLPQSSMNVPEPMNAGFADFTQFPESNETIEAENSQDLSKQGVTEQSHQIISALRTSERNSAFEVYRKPYTPRSSQSPDSLKILQPNSSTNHPLLNTTISNAEYGKRVSVLSETLRHLSLKQNKNCQEVLHYLREQNALLFHLCNDLNSELLTVQQRKKEICIKLKRALSEDPVPRNIVTDCAESINVTIVSEGGSVHENV